MLNNNQKYKEFILSILDKLSKEQEWEKRIYINFKLDEDHLNSLEEQYGVVASSVDVGRTLLCIVTEMMCDNYNNAINFNDEDLRIDELSLFFGISSFDFNYKFDGEYLKINPKKMNLWDINRIREFYMGEDDFGL